MLLMKSAADAIVCVRGSLRFAPAENAPPASSPVRDAKGISSAPSMAAKWRASPSLKSAPHALRASGRLRVTMPIGPRRSNETGMLASCRRGFSSSRRQCRWPLSGCQPTVAEATRRRRRHVTAMARRSAQKHRQLAQIANLEVGRRRVGAAPAPVAVDPRHAQARLLRALDVVDVAVADVQDFVRQQREPLERSLEDEAMRLGGAHPLREQDELDRPPE